MPITLVLSLDMSRHEHICSGSEPARRVYRLTPEGREMLDLWIEYMKKQATNLTRFIKEYCQARERSSCEPTIPGPDIGGQDQHEE
jgi:hypothetical protein